MGAVLVVCSLGVTRADPGTVTIEVGESRVGAAVLAALGFVRRRFRTVQSESPIRNILHAVGIASRQTLGIVLLVLSTANLVLLGVVGELSSFALFSRLSILILGTLPATKPFVSLQ